MKVAKTLDEFTKLVASPKLTVVDFYADWCAPCKAIEPYVKELSQKYPHVQFIKVDVEAAQELASHLQISAMPTFQFYKAGKKVSEFRGANNQQLLQTIQQHSGGEAGGSFPGSGNRLGSSEPNLTGTTEASAARTVDKAMSNSNSNTAAYVLALAVVVFFIIAYLRGHPASDPVDTPPGM